MLREPCRILCLDNLATGIASRLAHVAERSDVAFVDHDLIQPYEPEEEVDYIVHAASIASPPWYRRNPLATIDVNVTGTRNLLELARSRHGARVLVSQLQRDLRRPTAGQGSDLGGVLGPCVVHGAASLL